MAWFRDHLKDVKGVFIVPQLLKAGFIFGGSGGRGVVLLCDPKTGRWGQPAFYDIGSVIKVNDDFNKDYYGKAVRPVNILVQKEVSNPGSASLREGLYKAER